MPIVDILNGPNLNLLGQREPEIYGHDTLEGIEARCKTLGAELGLSIRFRQSNAEHDLIDWIQQARGDAAAIVINAGAYSHTSVAILDALQAFEGVVMEVHLSNLHKREPFRHKSFVAARADGVIVGCGADGYGFALRRISALLAPAP